MSLQEEKATLRKQMKAVLAAIGEEERRELGLAAARNFAAMPEYREAGILLAFLSMKGEIQTEGLIGMALSEGKTVAVPRMESSPGRGDFIVFVPLSPDYLSWPRDRYGIPEPPAAAAALGEDELGACPVLVATPGMAFDRKGGRLGRGKGYYDRFLSGARAASARLGGSIVACGLCYAAQLVGEVPRDADDLAVELIASEKGVWDCRLPLSPRGQG
jgi:5-formyltetrahydrofolate cyclo-ligase